MDWSHLPSREEVRGESIIPKPAPPTLIPDDNNVVVAKTGRLGKIKMVAVNDEARSKLEHEQQQRNQSNTLLFNSILFCFALMYCLGSERFGVPIKVPQIFDVITPEEVKKVYVNTKLETASDIFSAEEFEKMAEVGLFVFQKKKKKTNSLYNVFQTLPIINSTTM
jgi:hypothetical protein